MKSGAKPRSGYPPWNEQQKVGWWLNQPIWQKNLSRNEFIFPKFRGEKVKLPETSHTHGSVENGCISYVSFLSFRGCFFHWTMILGERVTSNPKKSTSAKGDSELGKSHPFLGSMLFSSWWLNQPVWKNMSQNGNLTQIGVRIWKNHQWVFQKSCTSSFIIIYPLFLEEFYISTGPNPKISTPTWYHITPGNTPPSFHRTTPWQPSNRPCCSPCQFWCAGRYSGSLQALGFFWKAEGCLGLFVMGDPVIFATRNPTVLWWNF